MRRAIAVLGLVAMLSGCQTYRQSKITAIAGGLTTLGGVVILGVAFVKCPIAVDCGSDTADAETLYEVGAGLALLGITAALGGMLGMVHYREVDPSVDLVAVLQRQERIEQERRAWNLAKEAVEDARAGECSKVIALDRVVLDLDPDLHAKVFVLDVAIRRCLDAAGSGQ